MAKVITVHAMFPEWNAWTEFMQSVYGMAMSLDAMKSSHPVEVEAHHPNKIDPIFDSILYAKGASII
jgi:aminopeptidase N